MPASPSTCDTSPTRRAKICSGRSFLGTPFSVWARLCLGRASVREGEVLPSRKYMGGRGSCRAMVVQRVEAPSFCSGVVSRPPHLGATGSASARSHVPPCVPATGSLLVSARRSEFRFPAHFVENVRRLCAACSADVQGLFDKCSTDVRSPPSANILPPVRPLSRPKTDREGEAERRVVATLRVDTPLPSNALNPKRERGTRPSRVSKLHW